MAVPALYLNSNETVDITNETIICFCSFYGGSLVEVIENTDLPKCVYII